MQCFSISETFPPPHTHNLSTPLITLSGSRARAVSCQVAGLFFIYFLYFYRWYGGCVGGLISVTRHSGGCLVHPLHASEAGRGRVAMARRRGRAPGMAAGSRPPSPALAGAALRGRDCSSFYAFNDNALWTPPDIRLPRAEPSVQIQPSAQGPWLHEGGARGRWWCLLRWVCFWFPPRCQCSRQWGIRCLLAPPLQKMLLRRNPAPAGNDVVSWFIAWKRNAQANLMY